MSDELRQIKKIYGEEMMHLCRELFPTILETPGRLLSILTEVLAPTRSLAELIRKNSYQDQFKAWIYSIADTMREEKEIDTPKTPFELMEEAGYILYECHSEEDIQRFRHYYSRRGMGATPVYVPGTEPAPIRGEEICTFNGKRLERCIVFFAVKKNVDEIRREDFNNPKRQDEYGTSVISIQFSRDSYCTVSIKNRYNHTVANPDATFSNDLENIIPGLTSSFERYCGIRIQSISNGDTSNFMNEMRYFQVANGKYYYVNIVQKDEIAYCENNIIILLNTGEVIDKYAKNKERYILMDQYMVDLKEKTIFDPVNGKEDSFIRSIIGLGAIKNIKVIKNGDNRIINISYEDGKEVNVEVNKHNSIIRYENNHVKEIGNGFLEMNENVESITLSKAETIDDGFLCNNNKVEKIDLPQVKKIGRGFFTSNKVLKSISLPKVETIGNYFLYLNDCIQELSLPEVKEIGNYFMGINRHLKNIYAPKLEKTGNNFLYYNTEIEELFAPELKETGSYFMPSNNVLRSMHCPQLRKVGCHFLENSILRKKLIAELKDRGIDHLDYFEDETARRRSRM